MLNLNFALSFESLADQLIDCIQSVWQSPFEAPIVIFPDKTLEQWFKFRWMNRKNAVVKFNSKFLESFLFEILCDDSDCPQKLTASHIRSLILAWLSHPENLQGSQWQEVRMYLGIDDTDTDKPDENRLFDFADNLSSLYISYEISRPDGFNPHCETGFFNAWKPDANTHIFPHASKSREEWQKKIYNILFHSDKDALLTQSFHSAHEYITLPSLYEKRKAQGDSIFNYSSKLPIFLFWHAGMGQFYRMILHDFSKDHAVYAFVQNPCMDFWEDVQSTNQKLYHWRKPDEPNTITPALQSANENEMHIDKNENTLLTKWGRSGRDNIRLWCLASEYDFNFFDDSEQHPQTLSDSAPLLRKLQHLIIHRKNTYSEETDSSTQITECTAGTDPSVTISSAPSRIRETEALHSQICHLLQHGTAMQDILIIAPDIENYRTAISQVFDQAANLSMELRHAWSSEAGLHESVLHIPYTIIDGNFKNSLTVRALRTLFHIIQTQTLTRPDFFDLVRNPLVQAIRGITAENASSWNSWVVNMHIYRDRSSDSDIILPKEDWKKGIRRMLLSKLSDDKVIAGNDIILPFADIDSTDSNALCRFIDFIEELEDLCTLSRNNPSGLACRAFNAVLLPKLNAWLSLTQRIPALAIENKVYLHLTQGIEYLQYQYAALGGENDRISWIQIGRTLIDAAEALKDPVGSPFVNGLTFMSFAPERIIPIKHIFFIGMDSKSFPGGISRNTLDLRIDDPWPGDMHASSLKRYAFLSQIMCTSESIHLSYVCKDLCKDEDFYPSSVIDDLRSFIASALRINVPITAIPLDETRSRDTLFTSRELRNRRLYDLMMQSRGSHADRSAAPSNLCQKSPLNNVLPEIVSLNWLCRYLKDPFQARIAELLGSDGNTDNPENELYEPIGEESRNLIEIVKILALCEIVSQTHHADTINLLQAQLAANALPQMLIDAFNPQNSIASEAADRSRIIQNVLDAFIQQRKDCGYVLENLYEQTVRRQILKDAETLSSLIVPLSVTHSTSFDISMENRSSENMVQKWILRVSSPSWYSSSNRHITVADIRFKKEKSDCKTFIKAYLTALALIVQQSQSGSCPPNEEIQADLTVCCLHEKNNQYSSMLTVSPTAAQKILSNIYQYLYIDQYHEAAPLELAEDTKIESFKDLENELKKPNGPWEYFDNGRIFDLQKDIGYDPNHFVPKWNEVKKRQLDLVRLLQPIDKGALPEDNINAEEDMHAESPAH